MIYTVHAPCAQIIIPNTHTHTHNLCAALCLCSQKNHTSLRHSTHCYSFLCVIVRLCSYSQYCTASRSRSLLQSPNTDMPLSPCSLLAEHKTSHMIQQKCQRLFSLLNLKGLEYINTFFNLRKWKPLYWSGGGGGRGVVVLGGGGHLFEKRKLAEAPVMKWKINLPHRPLI